MLTAACRAWTTSICGSRRILVNVRLEQEKLCLLVMIGVRTDGKKELIALTDGYRESTPIVGRVAARRQTPRDAGPGAGDG